VTRLLERPGVDHAAIAAAVEGLRDRGATCQAYLRGDGTNVCVNAVNAGSDGWPGYSAAASRRAAAASRRAAAGGRRMLPVLDSGDIDGRLWIAYDMGSATSLSDQRGRHLLPTATSLRVLSDVARALDDAAAEGVFASELPPASVFVSGKAARLGDLGTAREGLAGAEYELEGDPAYVPPEVLRGGRSGERSGVYLFGALLHYLLTGGPPQNGSARAANAKLDLPASIKAIVAAAMADDPEARPHSLSEAHEMAKRALRGEPPARTRRERTRRVAATQRTADTGQSATSKPAAVKRAAKSASAKRATAKPATGKRAAKSAFAKRATAKPATGKRTAKPASAKRATAKPATGKRAAEPDSAKRATAKAATGKRVTEPASAKRATARLAPGQRTTAATRERAASGVATARRVTATATASAMRATAGTAATAVHATAAAARRAASGAAGAMRATPRAGADSTAARDNGARPASSRPVAARLVTPRRAIALSGALLLGAATGLLLGNSPEPDPAPPHTVTAGGLTVTLPSGRHRVGPSDDTLSIRAPGSHLRARVLNRPPNPPPQARPVRLGAHQAWRHAGGTAVRYAIPTTEGTLQVSCRMTDAGSTRQLRLCERTASTIELRQTKAIPLADAAENSRRLSAAMADLSAERDAATALLSSAATPGDQQLVAQDLAESHQHAATVLQEIEGAEAIEAAARGAADAYSGLAAAAESGSVEGWTAASERVRRSDAVLAEAVAAAL
jgi:protein kinase-like protein